MKLKNLAEIRSGHLSRKKIEPRTAGTHYLLQARDVDGDRLDYRSNTLVRFNPALSPGDCVLTPGDIVFMARGSRNFSIPLTEIPKPLLAAACFFVVRIRGKAILPAYLSWYLNRGAIKDYFRRHSGRGVHMPVVRRAVLENVEIPTPPLETQRKIVELTSLAHEEEKLLTALCKRRRLLVEEACLQAAESK